MATHNPSNKVVRRVIGETGGVFPRRFRCAHSTDITDTITHARIDCRRALAERSNTVEQGEVIKQRKGIDELFESTVDVMLEEIVRYIGPLDFYMSLHLTKEMT